MRDVRLRFWLECVLSLLTTVAFVASLVSHQWIETVFGVDPDAGSGALEWSLVVVLGLSVVATSAAVRREWRRSAVFDAL